MARFTLEEFTGSQPELIYIAGNLTEAKQVEVVLDEEHIDYALKIESFAKQSFLGGTYLGMFFYVAAHDAQDSRAYLALRGLTDTLVVD